MFTWSTVHVMNGYIDNVCIGEDDDNSPKENVPPPFPLTYPKIYPIIFLVLSDMPAPPILLLYFLVQFMCHTP